MLTRPRTLTIKMTDAELHRAHALADAGDESVGRYVRRMLARLYEERFGDAHPPKAKLRKGGAR